MRFELGYDTSGKRLLRRTAADEGNLVDANQLEAIFLA
jgi:hypothetical protein